MELGLEEQFTVTGKRVVIFWKQYKIEV